MIPNTKIFKKVIKRYDLLKMTPRKLIFNEKRARLKVLGHICDVLSVEIDVYDAFSSIATTFKSIRPRMKKMYSILADCTERFIGVVERP